MLTRGHHSSCSSSSTTSNKTMEYRRTDVSTFERRLRPTSSQSSSLWDTSTYVKVLSPINSIAFSSEGSFAITSATRLQLFHARTAKPTRTISRFSDVVRSASFRHDGKLLVAGDDAGVVQVFDASARTALRQFKGHSLPVHCVRFCAATSTEVVSASDDRTVRLWDIPQERQVRAFTGHDDYVRSVFTVSDAPSLLLSGSYDGTARLWDSRTHESEGCVMRMKHAAPVEDVALFSSSTSALSVGGPVLRSWDLLMGGRCRVAVSNHSKTITALATNGDTVVTAGLDQLVKVYDAANEFTVQRTMRYSAPLLSCAISQDGQELATGMTDGTLCVQRTTRRRARRLQSHEQSKEDEQERTSDKRSVVVATTERKVAREARGDSLKSHDRLLKAFRYRDALDRVLRKGVRPETTFALLDELRNRNTVNAHGVVVLDGLRRAIEGRDDVTLEPLLRFCLRHSSNALYTSIICDTLDVVMDVYAPVLGQSPLVDELFGRLWTKVSGELTVQRQVSQVRGALEMILVRSSIV